MRRDPSPGLFADGGLRAGYGLAQITYTVNGNCTDA
jgi:hypothetical protein